MKKNILIVVLVLIILGLVGYICYDNGLFTKKEDKQKEEKIVEEELELDDSRFIDLYNQFAIDAYYTDIKSQDSLNLKEYELFSMGLSLAEPSDFVKTDQKDENDSYIYTLKYDVFNKGIEKYLGSDFGFDPATYKYETGKYEDPMCIKLEKYPEGVKDSCFSIIKYDQTNNEFYGVFSAVGGMNIQKWYPSDILDINVQEIEKAVLKGDTITVTEKVIYYNEDADNGKMVVDIYSDRDKKNKLDTKTYTYKDGDEKKYKIKVSDYDNCGHIIYKFKYDKKLDSYYFYSAVEEK